MPIYEEKKQNRRKSLLILAIAFLIIYMPFQIGGRELRWEEHFYATMALEMNLLNPNTIAHGEVISSNYPLYPWVVSLMYRAGATPEFGLRLISVLSVLVISLIVWEAGRRAVGNLTSVVSASLVLTSLIMIEKGLDGFPNMLGLLFILAAWVAWFTYGPVRGNWNRAWFVSLSFCGLAFYTIGWSGVFIFILPLLFMRRPMTIWSRLNKTGLYFGMAVLVFFILIWGIPRWIAGSDIPFRNIPFQPDDFLDYIKHLLLFPFELAVRISPLCLFAWPAFCAAYTPLDKNPVFSRFLKTIATSIFFFLWFYPFTDPRDYCILVPPLAILAGMNYWLLVRRLGFQLHRILKILAVTGLVFAVSVLLFYALPPTIWKTWFGGILQFFPADKLFDVREANRMTGLVFSGASILILAYVIKKAPLKCTVWLHSLLIICSIALLYWASMYPYQSHEKRQRNLARHVRSAMGEDYQVGMTIYKMTEGLFPLCTYLQCSKDPTFPFLCKYDKISIKRIGEIKELEQINSEIYVFSTVYPTLSGNPRPQSKKIPITDKVFLYKLPKAETGGPVK